MNFPIRVTGALEAQNGAKKLQFMTELVPSNVTLETDFVSSRIFFGVSEFNRNNFN
jgi:hypothetical protein